MYSVRNLSHTLSTVIACSLLLAFSASIATAQFESTTLTGVVTDAAGALVPAANIRAINEATNIETAPVTNAEGRFQFPNLRPGSYKVVASALGFKQFVSTGVILQVN